MADNAPGTPGDYDVVLLVERPLTDDDARRVRSLHEGLETPVIYHVLFPVEDAAARIEAAMGTVTGHDLAPGPAVVIPPIDLTGLEDEAREQAAADLAATLAALRASGARADGKLVTEHPIDALAATVAETDGREAIILTRPHVVAEFFHLDWTSRARRKIGVPVLHLLEHKNFDEQAGGGEGATLI